MARWQAVIVGRVSGSRAGIWVHKLGRVVVTVEQLGQVMATVKYGLGATVEQGLFLHCDRLMQGSGIEGHGRDNWDSATLSLSPDWMVLW